jgi:peptidoglycan/LPS O-acetylase OafA/YrhL
MPRERFPALTSLRFFAAFLVLLSHGTPFLAGRIPFLDGLAAGADFAVPFFFTLSGFVLTHAEADLPATLFWRRRFAKVAPLFYLSLVLHAPIAWHALNARVPVLSPGDLAVGIAGNGFFLGAWFPKWLYLNPPGWTLSAEAFFYLSFPALLPLCRRVRFPWVGFAACVAAGGAIQLARGANGEPSLMDFFYTNPLVHLPEFAAGIFLARGIGTGGSRVAPSLLITAGALGLAALGAFGATFGVTALRSFAGVPFYACLIWGACGLKSGPLRSRALVALGEGSYALYVLHWPLLDAFRVFHPPTWVVLTALLSFPPLSVFAFRYLETPARRALLGGAVR